MDPISQARLDALRVTDANNFTEDDAAFLRARASYLTSDEKEKFEAILKEKNEPKALSKMTVEELKALAADQNIAIDDTDKKADIIAKLEAAQQ